MGTNEEVRRVNLANCAIRTSVKFTTGVKYQFHKGFDQIRDPEIPINLRPYRHIDTLNTYVETDLDTYCR